MLGPVSRTCQVLRVFTRGEEGGNHLGVVTEVEGLGTEVMQGTATELGYAETVFCDLTGEVPTTRIFTPGTELPFAGHPMVGLAWWLNQTLDAPVSTIRCQVGDIDVTEEAGRTWIRIAGDQPVSPVDPPPLDGELAVTVAMPVPYLLVRLPSARQVVDLVPPPTSLGLVYTWAWEDPGQVVKARFFAAEAGVPEDPATGSAAVALAAHLRDAGRVEGSLVIHQGDEIGHPSTIRLRWDAETTSIGGTVVPDGERDLAI
jgi:predicted PhzF superfamily epimerase YddE/YHI9